MIKFSKYAVVGVLSASLLTACQTKQDTGTLIGAGAGALIGSQFGGGAGQLVAVGLGAVAGALVGGAIGGNMDKTDKLEAQQSLEASKDNQTTTWKNPNNESTYEVTPTKTYVAQNHQPCRDYTMQVTMADGKHHTVYGKACRQSDGTWQDKGTQN